MSNFWGSVQIRGDSFLLRQLQQLQNFENYSSAPFGSVTVNNIENTGA